jgi:hypothetical protein
MKRIYLRTFIEDEMYYSGFDRTWDQSLNNIIKLIQNNYRRRKYHIRQYTCNSCGLTLKAGKICQCLMLKRGRK